MRFRVPFEEEPPTIGDLLMRAWPEADDDARERALDQGGVRVEGRLVRDASWSPDAGDVVEAEVGGESGGRDLPEAAELARGDDWIVVDKPPGMPGRVDRDDPMDPVLYLADVLGVDRETFTPAWPMPTRAAGPWLFGIDPPSARGLRGAWADGDLMVTWVALVSEPEIPHGEFEVDSDWSVQYGTTNIRDGLAEVQLTPRWENGELPADQSPADELLDAMADQGMPVLGDRERGGFMVAGPLRLRVTALYRSGTDLQESWQPDDAWWPSERVVPEEADEPEASDVDVAVQGLDLPQLLVDAEVLAKIRDGLRSTVPSDAVAGRRGRAEPGSMVQLSGTDDVAGPYAVVESGATAAVVWSDAPGDVAEFDQAVQRRIDRAWANRKEWLANVSSCDLFRLVHGLADGLPGLVVDRVGPLLRVGARGHCGRMLQEVLYEDVAEREPKMMVVEYDLGGGEVGQRREGARLVRGGGHYVRPGEPVVGREWERRYVCNPWSPGEAFDASLRPVRRSVAEVVQSGDDWAVASEPTTHFSIVIADVGGTASFSDVDAPSGAILERTRELNGIAEAGLQRQSSMPEELVGARDDWDGVVLDLDLFGASIGAEQVDGALEFGLERLRDAGTLVAYRQPIVGERPLVEIAETKTGAAAAIEELTPPGDYPTGDGDDAVPVFEGVVVDGVGQ